MSPKFLALPLVLAGSAANAQPASTLAGLWQALDRCTRSVVIPQEAVGSQITVLFSIKRDGELQGRPRITFAQLTGDVGTQEAFVRASLASIARCFPLPITDGLGGAVAGRPLRLRIAG